MGIVIDYKGTLDDIARPDNLIADVRLFCQQAGWEYTEVAEHISGIAMGTPEDFMEGPEERSRGVARRRNLPFGPSDSPFRLEESGIA